jgi:hypothetical protein
LSAIVKPGERVCGNCCVRRIGPQWIQSYPARKRHVCIYADSGSYSGRDCLVIVEDDDRRAENCKHFNNGGSVN